MVLYNQLLLNMSSTPALIQFQTLTMFTLLINDHGLIVDQMWFKINNSEIKWMFDDI